MVGNKQVKLDDESIVEEECDTLKDSESTLSNNGKIPKAKKNHRVCLGREGTFDVVKGKPLPNGIGKKFYNSLKTEGII
ncbi:MAG: hypothetical protein ACTSW1_08255 [Candidatus Hodarchaeales archaeon]